MRYQKDLSSQLAQKAATRRMSAFMTPSERKMNAGFLEGYRRGTISPAAARIGANDLSFDARAEPGFVRHGLTEASSPVASSVKPQENDAILETPYSPLNGTEACTPKTRRYLSAIRGTGLRQIDPPPSVFSKEQAHSEIQRTSELRPAFLKSRYEAASPAVSTQCSEHGQYLQNRRNSRHSRVFYY